MALHLSVYFDNTLRFVDFENEEIKIQLPITVHQHISSLICTFLIKNEFFIVRGRFNCESLFVNEQNSGMSLKTLLKIIFINFIFWAV